MQKSFFSFLFLPFFLSVLFNPYQSSAQSVESDLPKKCNWLAEDSKGFYNVTTFSVDFFKGPLINGMQTINGYRLNPFIAIGGGVGIERYVNMNLYDTLTANLSLLPVFGEIRYTLLNKKVTPVVALQGGYKFLLNRPSSQITSYTIYIFPPYAWTSYDEYDYYTQGGFFFTVEGGVKAKVYKRLAVYVSASYSVWSVSGDHYTWAYQYLSAPGGQPKVTTSHSITPTMAYNQIVLFRFGIAF